jgi:hypothetical protein
VQVLHDRVDVKGNLVWVDTKPLSVGLDRDPGCIAAMMGDANASGIERSDRFQTSIGGIVGVATHHHLGPTVGQKVPQFLIAGAVVDACPVVFTGGGMHAEKRGTIR